MEEHVKIDPQPQPPEGGCTAHGCWEWRTPEAEVNVHRAYGAGNRRAPAGARGSQVCCWQKVGSVRVTPGPVFGTE